MTTLKLSAQIRAALVTKANLDKLGRYVVERAQGYANFNAGRPTKLAETITYEVNEFTGVVLVKVGSDVGNMVEFGTEPHEIRPKNGKALHWTHSGLGGGNVPMADGSQIKTGDDVFAQVVHHPGTAPKPFLRPAVDDAKVHLKDFFR